MTCPLPWSKSRWMIGAIEDLSHEEKEKKGKENKRKKRRNQNKKKIKKKNKRKVNSIIR